MTWFRFAGLGVCVIATAGRAGPILESPDMASLVPADIRSGAAVTTVAPSDAVAILGKKVLAPNNKDVVGQIVDVLVDKNGKPSAAVIDVGGFLGVGSRKIAVDWQMLHFTPSNRDAPVTMSLTRAELQSAPEYKPSGVAAAVVVPPDTKPLHADPSDDRRD